MRPPIILSGIIPIFTAAAAAAAAAESSSSDVGKSYRLYHKLGNDPNLTPRGTIKIAPSSDADGGGLAATFHPETSARLDAAAFDAMVESDAFYTLVVSDEEGGSSRSSSEDVARARVSASVPGCSLRRSNLREEIVITVSPTGKLLSVSYRPVISPLAATTCQNLMPLSDKPESVYGRRGEVGESGESADMPFKTTVSFESHKPMMAIPTILPQQRPPPGLKWYRRNAKNNPNPLVGGSTATPEGHIPGVDDEQPGGFKSSFLYRYWYIILPMAIMGLFGGVDEEEVARQQRHASQSAGAAAAGGATVGAAVAARDSASAARQRRGKRD